MTDRGKRHWPRITAHLKGGPRDGETVDIDWLGKDLRYPSDEKEDGCYVFARRDSDLDATFHWRTAVAPPPDA
jgi:hypothetical protein